MKSASILIIAAAILGGAICIGALAEKNHDQHSTLIVPDDHKQLWHCGMHPQIVRDHPGDCPICHMALTPINSAAAASDSVENKILYWWDPMLGPSSISDHPGKSAMGMDLVPVYASQAGPEVQIDPLVVQNMGVRTAQVTRGTLTKTIRTVGLLSLPEPGLHDVSLKVGGWID